MQTNDERTGSTSIGVNNISLFELASRFPDHSIKVRGTGTMQSISSELEQAALRSSGLGIFYAGFQRLSSFPPQAATYRKLGQHLRGVYAFGIANREIEPLTNVSYVPLEQEAPLGREWFIVYNAPDFYAALLTCDVSGFDVPYTERRFEGILSFDEAIIAEAERLVCQALGTPTYAPLKRNAGQRLAHQAQVSKITDRVLGKLEEANRTLEAAYEQVSELNEENQRVKGLLQNLLAQETWSSVSEAAHRGEELPAAKVVMVNVLFTDIADFTSISESFSPETVVSMLNRYFNVLTPIVYRHGGDIDKYIGDGLMATFSNARAALDAGREILVAVSRFNSGQKLRGLPALQTRVGIANGKAILGSIGGQNRMDRTYIGDTVNVAARLQSQARPGNLLVSAETWARAGRPAGYAPRADVIVKGKREPLQVYEYKVSDEQTD